VRTDLDVDLEAVAVLADGQLVVVGDRGQILVSHDDGRSWRGVASDLTAHLWAVERFGAGVIIGGDEGLVVKLAPAGDDTWADRVNVFGGAKPLDAAFVGGPRGFITGGGLATYLDALKEAKPAGEEAEEEAAGHGHGHGEDEDEDEDGGEAADDGEAEAFRILAADGDAADFRANYGVELPAEAAAFRAVTAGRDPWSSFAEFRLDNPLRPSATRTCSS
jgi:hypothetical protein